MARIELGRGDWKREAPAREPYIALRNRFFEQNPALTEDSVALLARPGLRKAFEVGEGPCRGMGSFPGSFDESLFVVSGSELYRISQGGVPTLIGTIGPSADLSSVSMSATGTIGDAEGGVPNYLYVCAGGVLWCYTENGFASGTLTATGTISNNETVTIGSVVYKFTNSSVDAGSPDGTAGNPWLVALGLTDILSMQNLFDAIGDTGVSGSAYSTALEPHPTIVASSFTAGTTIVVRSNTAGIVGNGTTLSDTMANAAWGAGSTAGGGAPSLFQVYVPEDAGAISVAHINGYIVVVPEQSLGRKGRFYWINPGETIIDALNFATAERSPDGILQVKVFSDQIVFLGQSTTENWVTTGNSDAPFSRFQGVLFDRGVWEGTALQIKEAIFLVDNEGQVVKIAGGVEVVSTPAIAQRLRVAIQAQKRSVL